MKIITPQGDRAVDEKIGFGEVDRHRHIVVLGDRAEQQRLLPLDQKPNLGQHARVVEIQPFG